MTWLSDLFDNKQKDVPLDQLFPPVSGKQKQRFKFNYSDKHWLNENLISQQIKGHIDLAITPVSESREKWSFGFNTIEFDRTLNHIPEIYALFDSVKRADFYIDHYSGLVFDQLETINQEEVLKQKIKEVNQYINDSKQAGVFKKFLTNHLLLPEYAKAQLQQQIIMAALLNTLRIKKAMHHNLGLEQIAEAYSIKNYFGDQYHLPLKTCWLYKQPSKGNNIKTWARTGGLDVVQYDKSKIPQLLRELAGKVNINTNLQVDFSELYQFKNEQDFLSTDLLYAELYLQTAVNNVWFKESRVIIEIE